MPFISDADKYMHHWLRSIANPPTGTAEPYTEVPLYQPVQVATPPLSISTQLPTQHRKRSASDSEDMPSLFKKRSRIGTQSEPRSLLSGASQSEVAERLILSPQTQS